MLEFLLEVKEHQIHYLCLHLSGKRLVKGKFLYYHVEVIEKSILHILSDLAVEYRRNIERSVGLFNLLDPEIKTLQFFVNQILKPISLIHH